MKELEVKIAEIEGNSAEEKSKDLHSNEEIVPVSIQKTIGCFLVWPHLLFSHTFWLKTNYHCDKTKFDSWGKKFMDVGQVNS